LFGPPRSADETGAVLRLDLALEAGDQVQAQREARNIEAALSLAMLSVQAHPSLSKVAQALSDAAFQLGARALESTATTPTRPDAVHADLAGSLDGIETGLGLFDGPSAARPPVDAALTELKNTLPEAEAWPGRAAFVVATGRLGAALRALTAERGATARIPYVGARGEVNISALTLPAPRLPVDDKQAALGRTLFSDRRLSVDRRRSCADCHQPAHGFSDGKMTPTALPGTPAIRRNTPTLLYAALQAAQLWDGRMLAPEAQALGVLHAESEMGLSAAALLTVVRGDVVLRGRFEALFPDGVTERNIGLSLAAYEAKMLSPGRSPVDRFAAGESALDAEELAGLDVFCGRGRCARCHLPPLFGGTRPTDFAVPVYSVLGVPTAPKVAVLDADRGRGGITGIGVQEHAFKTPTVRDIALTGPYFHNGAFSSLEDVVDFYDRGGGRGLGLDVPNQDPDLVPLKLDLGERRALLAFLRRGLDDGALPK